MKLVMNLMAELDYGGIKWIAINVDKHLKEMVELDANVLLVKNVEVCVQIILGIVFYVNPVKYVIFIWNYIHLIC